MSNSEQNPRPTADGATEAQGEPHASVVSRIRNYFLTGLILVGPLYITVSLTWWFINWVDDACGRSCPRRFVPRPICRSTSRARA